MSWSLRSDESRRFSASALIEPPPKEALSFLGSASEGLLEIDAAARLERDGPNQLPGGRRKASCATGFRGCVADLRDAG
jgi:hypothetical protein